MTTMITWWAATLTKGYVVAGSVAASVPVLAPVVKAISLIYKNNLM